MRGAGRRFRHEGDAPVTDSSGRPRKRLRFFSYIVAKRLTAGPMADCNGSVVRHRGRAELVSQTAQRPLGSSLILSVSLVPCRAQARDAVALEIAFPGEEFVDRKACTPGRLHRLEFGRCARRRREPPCGASSIARSEPGALELPMLAWFA